MQSTEFRTEQDSFGDILVNNAHYWGAQTQRSLKFFNIGNEKMPMALIYAFGLQKQAAAKANLELGLLEPEIAIAIINATKEIIAGKMDQHFPLSVWQTGSGTQTNMNLNEVIANIANERLGSKLGAKFPVHPNDHVNKGQSSNDSFPTAMNIAVCIALQQKLLPQLTELKNSLDLHAQNWQKLIKIGRTHMQDATPMTLGQEFSAFAAQTGYNISRITTALQEVYYLAQGGTAVGTGINCHPHFAELFVKHINELTQLPFKSASNKFESLASHDSLVSLSGSLNTLASSLMKIANDIRLLSSGPRCGIGELQLPENEPGSSIMPGKVNPTQTESLTMICAQVMGAHTTISIAGSNGHLQLNVFKPVIIYNLLNCIDLLTQGCYSFNNYCVNGITPNIARIDELKNNSLMLVTALNSHIGYDAASKIAQKAFRENLTLKQAALALKIVSSEKFDELVRPEKMIHN